MRPRLGVGDTAIGKPGIEVVVALELQPRREEAPADDADLVLDLPLLPSCSRRAGHGLDQMMARHLQEAAIVGALLADEHGIDSIDDLAESGVAIRVANNNRGNITANITTFMLDEAGFDEATIEANGGVLVRGGSSQQADLITDGRTDMVINGIFVGHSSFRKVDKSNDVVLLSVPQEIIEKTNERFGTRDYTIPGGSYSNQAEDIVTLALGAMVVTSDALPEETGYTLAKGIASNIDEIRGVHNAMQELTPELLVSQTTLPFHPGAERAYKELGLIE